MGVLACERHWCDHIMCNRLILGQYICNECYDELLTFKKDWKPPMTELEMTEKIEEFMNSKPGAYKELTEQGIDELFENLSRKLH